MVTARDVDLPYAPIPDAWLLPPEPSAEAKQIAELQRRISTDYRRLPYPICSDLFVVTRDGVAGTRAA